MNEINNKLNDYLINLKPEADFILERVEMFEKLAYISYDVFFDVKSEYDYSLLEKMSIFEKIELIKSFYKKYDINLDLEQLLRDGTINFYEEIIPYFDGLSHQINSHKAIEVANTGTIHDAAIFVHELGHYRSQNISETVIREVFTEAFSYFEELLFYDYLEEMGFQDYVNFARLDLIRIIVRNADNAIANFRGFKIFDLFSNLSKETYESFYKDNTYHHIEKYFSKENNYLNFIRHGYYSIGHPIAIYLFMKTKENPIFINHFLLINEKLNSLSLNEIFKEIGLLRVGDDVLKNYLESFRDEYIIKKNLVI